MKKTNDIREASGEEIVEAIRDARQIDRLEAELMTGKSLEEAMDLTIALSSRVWSGYAGGNLVALFGVVPIRPLDLVGIPWLIATPEIDRSGLAFLRSSLYHQKEFRRGYDFLENYVLSSNQSAIYWLQWLGYSVGPSEPYGPYREKFRRFEWSRD